MSYKIKPKKYIKHIGNNHYKIWNKIDGHHSNVWLINKGNVLDTATEVISVLSTIALAKEGYYFKEWVFSKYDKTKEDIEDIIEEAKYSYNRHFGTISDTVINRIKSVLSLYLPARNEHTVNSNHRRTVKRKLLNIAMLAALIISAISALVGASGLHIASGIIFLAFCITHIYKHNRLLFV
ncbi:membrane protein [Candidatus Magnetoovum chiemensis]|nr:membrane protein [Candidatus Magnetoovum chiemensis]